MVYQLGPYNWAWYCRCGKTESGYAEEKHAQKAFDAHMRSDAW